MADGFAAAGYTSVYLGKWHLGGDERGGEARRRSRALDTHSDVSGAMLAAGTGGFVDTRYMWDDGQCLGAFRLNIFYWLHVVF